MKQANLSVAGLTAANLIRANLTDTILTNTKFNGARFEDAIWIDGKICKGGAIGMCKKECSFSLRADLPEARIFVNIHLHRIPPHREARSRLI